MKILKYFEVGKETDLEIGQLNESIELQGMEIDCSLSGNGRLRRPIVHRLVIVQEDRSIDRPIKLPCFEEHLHTFWNRLIKEIDCPQTFNHSLKWLIDWASLLAIAFLLIDCGMIPLLFVWFPFFSWNWCFVLPNKKMKWINYLFLIILWENA